MCVCVLFFLEMYQESFNGPYEISTSCSGSRVEQHLSQEVALGSVYCPKVNALWKGSKGQGGSYTVGHREGLVACSGCRAADVQSDKITVLQKRRWHFHSGFLLTAGLLFLTPLLQVLLTWCYLVACANNSCPVILCILTTQLSLLLHFPGN